MMKRIVLVTCAAGLMTTGAGAQQSRATAEHRATVELASQAGGTARASVETRVTRGKPYSGEAVTEFVQVLSDGNRIVRKTAARIYRDSDGRTRRETLTESGSAVEVNSVVITDPVAGISLILDAGTKTVIRAPGMFAKVSPTPFPGAGANVAVARIGPGEPRAEATTSARAKRETELQAQLTVTERGGQTVTFTVPDGGMVMARSGGQATREDLGEQVVEGVVAKGTRTTTVVPAGAIGNEQPITTISEQWFAEDLELLVLTKHSDPRVGETTYRLTNITRSEPDRSLFQAPADYTVQERPSRPPVMFRQQP
jgi:hypothetical protein